MPEHPSGRTHFVERVAAAFQDANVEFAFLHNYGLEGWRDSDVDVAVSSKSLATAEAVLRSGKLGQLFQCFHYGVPWCKYYVLESQEPGRRYRQLDLICDPWGIDLDGPLVRKVLDSAVVIDGLRVPAPGIDAVYLAVRRARKRMTGPAQQKVLLRAFRRAPTEAAAFLKEQYGAVGNALARDLKRGDADLDSALEALRRRVAWQRRKPMALARRAWFSMIRIAGRVIRPTGFVVCVSGPDGVGKSTLAQGLQNSTGGLFWDTKRHHLQPSILPSPARLLGREFTDTSEPHARPPSGTVGSIARILYLAADRIVGWVPGAAMPRLRNTLVVVERGWFDLAVDPRRYRLSSGVGLVRVLGSLLPGPDLVLVLDAPEEVVRERKAELPSTEIKRQLRVWRAFASRNTDRVAIIDGSTTATATLDQALEAIEKRLVSRQRTLGPASLALDCLGGPYEAGAPYTIIRATLANAERFPRWLVPARRGGRGPKDYGLYRPASAKNAVGSLAFEVLQRAGGRGAGRRLSTAPERGLAPAIAEVLGIDRVEIAAAVTGLGLRGRRVSLSVFDRDRLVAFAKVAEKEGLKLIHERAVLDGLANCSLEALVVPKVLGCFDWENSVVLLLSPLETPGKAQRAIGRPETAGLRELGRLSAALSDVLGVGDQMIPLHGDFTPWNSACQGSGNLALWDWEDARLGWPLEDFFWWRIQVALRSRRPNAGDLVASAIHPDWHARMIAGEATADSAAPSRALRACINKARSPKRRVPGTLAFLDDVDRLLARAGE